MKKILGYFAVFACGGVLSALATSFYFNKVREQDINKEVASYKDIMNKLQEQINELQDQLEMKSEDIPEPVKEETKQSNLRQAIINATNMKTNDYIITQENYSQYSKAVEKPQTIVQEKAPYVVSPQEFADVDGDNFTITTLHYYEGDETLTYDNDEIVTDPDELVGTKALSTFGEYEDDCVYVINEPLSEAIEILLVGGNYPYAR